MKSATSYSQLNYQDRQTIAISLEQGLSLRAIGHSYSFFFVHDLRNRHAEKARTQTLGHISLFHCQGLTMVGPITLIQAINPPSLWLVEDHCCGVHVRYPV